MFSFIKKHWLAYIIGVALAVAVGLGAAYVVGLVGTTPDDAPSQSGSSSVIM